VSNLREGSNNARDFLNSIKEFVAQRVLVPGDTVVADNATIHDAMEIFDELMEVLEEAQVRLVFLPTYSPELNPCELVFGESKSYMYHKRGKERFWLEVVKSLQKVTPTHMVNYYLKCIHGPLGM
jgi:transposase